MGGGRYLVGRRQNWLRGKLGTWERWEVLGRMSRRHGLDVGLPEGGGGAKGEVVATRVQRLPVRVRDMGEGG